MTSGRPDRASRFAPRHLLSLAAIVLLLRVTAAFAQPGVELAPATDSLFAAPGDTIAAPAPAAAGDSTTSPSAAARDTAPAPNRQHVVSTRKVELRQSQNVVRSGPGDRFAIAGVYPKGTSFTVVAKTGEWYNVRLSETETAWVHSSLCKEFDDLSDLEFRPNPKLYSRTGSMVLSGTVGAYAFDRKSNSLVLGARLGYYILDRLQFEAGLGWTHVQRPAEIVETLFGLSLEAEDFHMLFYNLNATFELLPGRQMVPYLTAGVGSSIMQGETEPTLNFGAGTTLFVSKRVATRWEVRGFRFESGPDQARVTNNNVEFALGTMFLF
jgi:outer membrane beta-barrel protein